MTEAQARALFLLAGIDVSAIHELMNGYWKDNAIRGAWWLVKTPFGYVRVGWRKRVIEIDWSETAIRSTTITSDDVTKEDTFVHAWTIGKAVDYLSQLRIVAANASVVAR